MEEIKDMKKIFLLIVLFISVAVSGYAQKTRSEIRDAYKEGVFYLWDEEFYIMFETDESQKVYTNSDGEVRSAVWMTNVMTENGKKGEDWFKEKMSTEEGQLVMFNLFYDKYRIILGDDYVVDSNGRAKITMYIE